MTVVENDELISEGTGFAINATGDLLTAAHVITGRWPINQKDYKNPAQKIYCKFPTLPAMEYRVLFCGLEIEVPAFTRRIQLDLAALVPDRPFACALPHIRGSTTPPQLGERLFMAGFSEELKLPFRVDKLLNKDFPGAAAFHTAMARGYQADMTGPLFKQGVVGNIQRAIAEDSTSGDRIEADVFYIDNSMHSGASGGPVFNESGDAVGVISQRAVTAVNAEKTTFEVPSGWGVFKQTA